MRWNLIEPARMHAAFNMALDEALFARHIDGAVGPVIRLYGWHPPAVSLGYAQRMGRDVDEKACARHGVHVVRRITGGGAVFHDREVTYSLVAPATLLSDNVTETYRMVSRALILGLGRLGVRAEFAPVNDLLVNGRKVSGSAQIRRRGSVLQHGTILVRIDTARMFELLPVPEKKLKEKDISRPEERVTSLEAILGREVSFDEVAAAMRAGFEEWAGEPLAVFRPDAETMELARRLDAEKYSRLEWNEKRKAPAGS
jgi:lipoate---protein ligase